MAALLGGVPFSRCWDGLSFRGNALTHVVCAIPVYRFERREVGGEARYTFAGMLTVCAFYGFPDKTRPRISQMCVLPQYQRQGHGEQLLQQAYKFIMSKFKGKMTDITVEDPSPAFRTLRDRVDCKNCWNAFPANEFYQQSFAEAAVAIKGKLCLYSDQARRVFEIIQLRLLGTRDPEVLKPYRLKIKTRLYQPHQSMSNNTAFRRFNDEKEDEAQAIRIGLTKEDKDGVMGKKDVSLLRGDGLAGFEKLVPLSPLFMPSAGKIASN